VTKDELVKYINSALSEVKYLASDPPNYAAACGVAEAALAAVKEFLEAEEN